MKENALVSGAAVAANSRKSSGSFAQDFLLEWQDLPISQTSEDLRHRATCALTSFP